MSDFLKIIYQKTKIRNQCLDRNFLHETVEKASQPHDFLKLFERDTPIIAEIKFASPSHGTLFNNNPDPGVIAQAYLENGAAALSILTEPEFFQGSPSYLQRVRKAYPQALILNKDFIIDEAQLLLARSLGADAVLLIADFLSSDLLTQLYHQAMALQLTPLIEVHSESDLTLALSLKPKLIGINNRNLKSLKIDLNTSHQLIKMIPNDVHVISESGLQTGAELKALKAVGFDGFLIGSQFMKTADPGKALQHLLREVRT